MVTLTPTTYGVRILDASAGEGFYLPELLDSEPERFETPAELELDSLFSTLTPDMPVEGLGLSKQTVKSIEHLQMRTLADIERADLHRLMAERKSRRSAYRELVEWLGDYPRRGRR